MDVVGLLTNTCGVLALIVLVLSMGGVSPVVPVEIEWIALMFGYVATWILQTVVLGACVLRGAFDWIPVKSSFRWAMILTAHAVIGLVTLAVLPHRSSPWHVIPATVVPIAVTIYSLLLLNSGPLRLPANVVRIPAIVAGGVAAALATVSMPLTVETIRENWRQAEWGIAQTEQRRVDRVIEERSALSRLRGLGANAELQDLLPFAVSNSNVARSEAVQRIAALPGLAQRLAVLMNSGELMLRHQVTAYIADDYSGTSAPVLCGPLSAHLLSLRQMLDSQLEAPWTRSRNFYQLSSKALEAAGKLSRFGCGFEAERDQWLRSLESAGAGLLRDLLLGKLNATGDGQPKLWMSSLN